MDPNSPVKMMLPEAPVVPDSEMDTESPIMGFAGDSKDWKNTGPARETRILRIPDDSSTGFHECEVVITHPEEYIELVYYTADREDFKALEMVLALDYERDGPEYKRLLAEISEIQLSFEEEAASRGWGNKYCGKLCMEVLLDKEGYVLLADFDVCSLETNFDVCSLENVI